MNSTWSPYFDGAMQASCQTRSFAIGPWSFEYANGDLLYIQWNKTEIVRRIYGAVRDESWGTLQPMVTNETFVETSEQISIEFDVSLIRDEIDFHWHGAIRVERDGAITYAFSGLSRSDFRANRIGLCLLHTVDHVVGKRCNYVDGIGLLRAFFFPVSIDPENLASHIASMTYSLDEANDLSIGFSGELFEIEDQRNWIDDSFKTFCRPLSEPRPIEFHAGDTLEQSIALSVVPKHLRSNVASPSNECGVVSKPYAHSLNTLRLGSDLPRNPHPIGLNWESAEAEIDELSWSRLRNLGLAHIRVHLDGDAIESASSLPRFLAIAQRVNAKLEIAVRTTPTNVRRVQEWIAACDGAWVARVMLYSSDAWNTSSELAKAWRDGLNASNQLSELRKMPLFVGTLANFTELNRDRSAIRYGDGVCYSVQPQEHAFDNLSLVETAKVIGQTVESARALAPDMPIAVTPITLRKRVNPYGAAPAENVERGLPLTVDPRQMSLLGAGWTVSALKYLSEAGVGSSTWYEPIGWKGVMESPRGSRNALLFPSTPGMLYPIYYVLREWCRWSGATLIATQSSDRLRFDGAACRYAGETRVMVANLRSEPMVVSIEWSGLQGNSYQTNVRHLDCYSLLDFDSVLAGGNVTLALDSAVEIPLKPFAIAFLSIKEVPHAIAS
jgi:D-apionolactonase